MKIYQRVKLYNLRTLVDGELDHPRVSEQGRAPRRERLLGAILPEWRRQTAMCRDHEEYQSLPKAHWLGGFLNDAAKPCNECRADLEEWLELGEVNEEDLIEDLKGRARCGLRNPLSTPGVMESKTRAPKCMGASKLAQLLV